MIEPLGRSRRDSTRFQFNTRQLWDFIHANHLLIRIDEQLDFTKLVEPWKDCYCPDFGRPAIHPEVMVKALLICSLYNIASFRRLCPAISKILRTAGFVSRSSKTRCSTILPSATASTGLAAPGLRRSSTV